jgi:pyruvate/2-oxoglutarate dehydrogenase complex dihydrolipoamide acyltransferase (E2) component
MPTPLYTPRVNNNDDSVRLVKLLVKPGDAVRTGQLVAEVETDKANFTVESDRDGFVLSIARSLNETIDVGSVLLWLGTTADEAAPVAAAVSASRAAARGAAEPTLKAAQLLTKHGLSPSDVPPSGERLSVADVEAFLASREEKSSVRVKPDATTAASPAIAPGLVEPLSPEERGMLRTVLWQRDEAVPGYVELAFDASVWDRAASDYQKREKLLLSPLLALMAHRLARLAAAQRRLNSTIVGDARHVYSNVNLGFTIQSDTTLYLGVVHDAASLGCREFVEQLGRIQRGALAHTLRAADLTGATVSFSSMARWNVARHVPVLPPFTSLIVAHAGTRDGVGTLGATYDHRVLTGFDALSVLQALAQPEEMS